MYRKGYCYLLASRELAVGSSIVSGGRADYEAGTERRRHVRPYGGAVL